MWLIELGERKKHEANKNALQVFMAIVKSIFMEIECHLLMIYVDSSCDKMLIFKALTRLET